MKKIIILLLTPVPFMFFTLRNDFEATPIQEERLVTALDKEVSAISKADETLGGETTAPFSSNFSEAEENFSSYTTEPDEEARLEMIAYALTLLGTPYIYGGTTANGFDCSGFTTHVYDTVGVKIGRSSTLQALDGVQVSREDAREGDLLIFTGTNLAVREPGHAGIIISATEDTISFVHSSSVGGVKISKVEGTRYSDRLLQIRRVM